MGFLAPFIPAAAGLLGGLFGGKKPRQVNRNIDEYVANAGHGYDPYIQSRQQNIGDAQTRSSDAYQRAMTGYQGILDAGGSVPGQGQIGSDIDTLRQFGNNPIDAASMARMRGGGGFEEFARTGGWTPEARRDVELSNAAIPASFFSSLAGLNNRNNVISGGQNPGFTAQNIALSRTGAREGQQAALDARMALEDSVRKGRQWGIGGMTSSEEALQSLLGRDRLAAMEGVIQGGTGLASLQNKNQLEALQGIRGLRTDVPGEVNMYDRELLGLLGQQGDEQSNALRLQMGYNPNNEGDFMQRFARYAAPFAGLSGGGARNSNLSSGAGQAIRYLPSGMASPGQYQQGNYLGNLPSRP